MDQLYQEVEEFERVKESNDSLKKQIVFLESSENYQIEQIEKEIQTEEIRKIEELIEVNQKLQEENQNLMKELELLRIQSSKDLNEKIEELKLLQEENQTLIKKIESESVKNPESQLSSEMYKQLECKHRQIVKELQMAHEKEKLNLSKATTTFSGIKRRPFSTLDHLCLAVFSNGVEVGAF